MNHIHQSDLSAYVSLFPVFFCLNFFVPVDICNNCYHINNSGTSSLFLLVIAIIFCHLFLTLVIFDQLLFYRYLPTFLFS